jgi:hypothetical protein
MTMQVVIIMIVDTKLLYVKNSLKITKMKNIKILEFNTFSRDHFVYNLNI